MQPQFAITCSRKHKLTNSKQYKGELLGSFTATLTTCLTLMHYIVLPFLASQTAENSSHASSSNQSRIQNYTPVQQSNVGVFINQNKARMSVEQAEDEIRCLSTADRIVSATCIWHMKVTTVLVMVQNQSNAVNMKPFRPTTGNIQHQYSNQPV